MGDAVIVSTARTAIGTACTGTLVDVIPRYAAIEAGLDHRHRQRVA